MQWSIVLLILFAAALHAGWNVPIKSESGDSSNTVVIIVLYTLVDAQGARLSGHAFSYTGWMLFLLAAFFLVLMPAFEGRQVFLRIIGNWKKSLLGGSLTFASYGITLWAMTQAPVALVAGLRETSIFFGTIFSAMILKERVTFARGLSIFMIVAGAIAIKFS